MKSFDNLLKIMKKLRNPINGCPWDQKQKPQDLREYVLEEAYEVIETIENDDPEKLKEELGDLMLQIVFLSQIYRERNQFSIRDVLDTINRKLIRRHPHIFSNTQVDSAEDVKRNWEQIKKTEKKRTSILSDYPVQMPALSHAQRVAEQASGVGFDWDDPLKALDKVEEEVEELKQELKNDQSIDRDRVEDEIGDILFAVANVARLAKINPEFALKRTTQKFVHRFRFIEAELKQRGKDIRETSLMEMEDIWQQAKTIGK